ncbi:MAG: hypothetical protein JWN66_4192 [Sphingomonas bacterium]|uniref:hypothetical protein n=1 Tax=Sphingomonas bacterium TaxID=1895847 RepID=UPI00262FD1B8|nr:hypothetical protein [Sphingomonas bacterium]MDB5707076.1 hypothetical protein [Sphingomonas bacterium]
MRKILLLLAAFVATPASAQTAASLVGSYDGHQMEMGAELHLLADGRFEYGVAYGALDEAGQGSWRVEGDRVLLTSDPVTPPRFVFTGQKPAPSGTVRFSLEAPQGVSLQYFDAVVLLAHGGSKGGQLSDDGLSLPLDPADPPVSARMFFPMYQLKSDAAPIDPAKGYWLSFRFEPNDIGKADFRGTALTIDHGDLLLDRFGRTIRFRRVG